MGYMFNTRDTTKNKIFQGQLSARGGLHDSFLLKIPLNETRSLRTKEQYIKRVAIFEEDVIAKDIPVPQVMRGL